MDHSLHLSNTKTDSRRFVIASIVCLIASFIGWQTYLASAPALSTAHAAIEEIAHGNAPSHGSDAAHHAVVPPALYSVIPFVVLLMCIALLPLIHSTEHWWEHNSNRFLVSASLGIATLLYYALFYGHGIVDHSTHELTAAGWPAAVAVLKNSILVEYIPFIVLLFSLYVISGGIAIEGSLVGRPRLNTGIIGIGAVMASFIGTTGAAMLLIRPLLRANAKRQHVAHTVVFFIFVVCNTGGCLLPIGDPPLFLGYLRGVEFLWTLNLWPMWLFTNLSLLAVYFAYDSVVSRKENADAFVVTVAERQPFAIRGALNFAWLTGVIVCVALLDPSKPLPGTHWHAPLYLREVLMLSLTALSLWLTSAAVREKNSFNYGAIVEVAALFTGIFICMQAPVQILNVHGPSLGLDQPWKFFWSTGSLSSFLDNAPTYVVFFETAKTLPTEGVKMAGVLSQYLIAVSLGAVFMGAMTYIGNGPNFMVKAIAEKNNVRMPSFFGYIVYSCVFLLPIFGLMTYFFMV
ncbi:MAG: sodium:proton antiporter [Planctomycetaceae bacterium]